MICKPAPWKGKQVWSSSEATCKQQVVCSRDIQAADVPYTYIAVYTAKLGQIVLWE